MHRLIILSRLIYKLSLKTLKTDKLKKNILRIITIVVLSKIVAI